MTIYISPEQWDELQKLVGVVHGYKDERELLVNVQRWGDGSALLRFRAKEATSDRQG